MIDLPPAEPNSSQASGELALCRNLCFPHPVLLPYNRKTPTVTWACRSQAFYRALVRVHDMIPRMHRVKCPAGCQPGGRGEVGRNPRGSSEAPLSCSLPFGLWLDVLRHLPAKPHVIRCHECQSIPFSAQASPLQPRLWPYRRGCWCQKGLTVITVLGGNCRPRDSLGPDLSSFRTTA